MVTAIANGGLVVSATLGIALITWAITQLARKRWPVGIATFVVGAMGALPAWFLGGISGASNVPSPLQDILWLLAGFAWPALFVFAIDRHSAAPTVPNPPANPARAALHAFSIVAFILACPGILIAAASVQSLVKGEFADAGMVFLFGMGVAAAPGLFGWFFWRLAHAPNATSSHAGR